MGEWRGVPFTLWCWLGLRFHLSWKVPEKSWEVGVAMAVTRWGEALKRNLIFGEVPTGVPLPKEREGHARLGRGRLLQLWLWLCPAQCLMLPGICLGRAEPGRGFEGFFWGPELSYEGFQEVCWPACLGLLLLARWILPRISKRCLSGCRGDKEREFQGLLLGPPAARCIFEEKVVCFGYSFTQLVPALMKRSGPVPFLVSSFNLGLDFLARTGEEPGYHPQAR